MPRVVIKSKCKHIKSCMGVCPADAFVDCGDHVVIDPDKCIDCGACEMTCPEGAILDESSASNEDIDYNASRSKQ